MARFSGKYAQIATVAAIAAMLPVSLAASTPPGDLMYVTIFYSDATHTEIVGRQRDICTMSGVSTGPVMGTATAFYEENAVAYCINGNKHPL